MKLIIHAVAIKASRQRVYEALATRRGLAAWWTTDVTGDSVPGGTLAFRFADVFKPDIPWQSFGHYGSICGAYIFGILLLAVAIFDRKDITT